MFNEGIHSVIIIVLPVQFFELSRLLKMGSCGTTIILVAIAISISIVYLQNNYSHTHVCSFQYCSSHTSIGSVELQ